MTNTRKSRFATILGILVVLAVVASACTSDSSDDTTIAPTTTAAPSTTTEAPSDIKNPDVFVHAADDEPTTLDPAQVEPGEGGETVILQVYERLLEIGVSGPDPIPALATEVPSVENGLITGDGTVFTFPLREGVTFHDGTAFTADDVLYSWDRVMTMDLPDGAAGVLSDTVESMRVVDDFTFEVTLQTPNAAFLNAVVPAMVSSIVSQDAVEANGGVVAGEFNEYMSGNPVGTGPY